jgi:WD40 repeat protein
LRLASFSPDGKMLLGRVKLSVHVFDLAESKQRGILTGDSAIRTVACSPWGRIAAAGYSSKQIVLWDVLLGRELARADDATDQVLCACFTPDGSRLAAGQADGKIGFWNVKAAAGRR